MSTEDGAEVLNDAPLEGELSRHDEDEPLVIEDLLVEVDVGPAELARSELVEEVHEDESMEQDGEMHAHLV